MESCKIEKKEELLIKNDCPSIKKLDENTINKIAAGEVVISPSAALKELIENSIDAGSTQINILSQQGGLGLLQIQDDGHGIKPEDFPILCERFTTSKIEKFNDLQKVSSFGFRGEALASITYVSHLTVTSKIQSQELAYTSGFKNGQMIQVEGESCPRPCAGHKGTIIQVRDLFYNQPQRKKSMSSTEEYQKIVDVVSRYSIHYPLIKFTCKRVEDKKTDVSTYAINRPSIDQLESEADLLHKLNDIRIEIIKRQFGQAQVGKELYKFLHQWELLEIGCSMIISKPNTVTYKKNMFLLFINNRIVTHDKIKRTVESIYNIFQPKGGYSYFVYIALSVRPDLIDVNVHPTKKQVIFERQDELCEALQELLESKIQDIISSRSFQIDNITLKQQTQISQNFRNSDQQDQPIYTHTKIKDPQGQRNLAAIKAIRTDYKAMTLDKFFMKGNTSLRRDIAIKGAKDSKIVVPQQLMSVKKLIYEYENDIDENLQKLFKKHSYVGMIGIDQVLVQFQTKLVLVQVYPVIQEYIYQLVLSNFQCMQKFVLYKPLPIQRLLELALEHPDSHYNPNIHLPKQDLVQIYSDKLYKKAEMLLDYFCIEIENQNLVSLPIIHEIIKPYPQELPMLVLRLCSEVNYTNEEECFKQIANELSHYYAKFIDFHAEEIELREGNFDVQQKKIIDDMKFSYENELFPELKQHFAVRKRFADEQDLTFTMITCTENLYKVFERC